MKSEFPACARNQKPVSFCKQSKLKEVQIKKNIIGSGQKGQSISRVVVNRLSYKFARIPLKAL